MMQSAFLISSAVSTFFAPPEPLVRNSGIFRLTYKRKTSLFNGIFKRNSRISVKTLGFLFQNYRKAFYKLAPSEEAQLIKLEYCPETVIEEADFSPLALKAEAYLILSRILSEPDFHKRSVIWNQYWSIIESKGFTYTETLESCERLVISQTFVQTQKLPFLLIQTPTSCGKCYNALNY